MNERLAELYKRAKDGPGAKEAERVLASAMARIEADLRRHKALQEDLLSAAAEALAVLEARPEAMVLIKLLNPFAALRRQRPGMCPDEDTRGLPCVVVKDGGSWKVSLLAEASLALDENKLLKIRIEAERRRDEKQAREEDSKGDQPVVS